MGRTENLINVLERTKLQEIKVKLDIFEGPLDLLLHLIKTLEIDIYDIPIAEVTDQYMSYIHAMQYLELELAGDYLVMAATLMAIKSQMLLPKQELVVDEDYDLVEEDPREALVSQLLEYRKYKYAAEVLQEKEGERSLYYTKEPMNIDEYKDHDTKLEPNQLNTIDLFLAFHAMLEKRKGQKPLETRITGQDISIEEKIDAIVTSLRTNVSRKGMAFESFLEQDSKQELVTVFMAMLELMKKNQIRVIQEDNFQPILLFPTESLMEDKND